MTSQYLVINVTEVKLAKEDKKSDGLFYLGRCLKSTAGYTHMNIIWIFYIWSLDIIQWIFPHPAQSVDSISVTGSPKSLFSAHADQFSSQSSKEGGRREVCRSRGDIGSKFVIFNTNECFASFKTSRGPFSWRPFCPPSVVGSLGTLGNIIFDILEPQTRSLKLSKVYFYEMYLTCVSSKLCEFIFLKIVIIIIDGTSNTTGH